MLIEPTFASIYSNCDLRILQVYLQYQYRYSFYIFEVYTGIDIRRYARAYVKKIYVSGSNPVAVT